MTTQNNTMGSTQSPVRMPDLGGPIHQQTHIATAPTESTLTAPQAETFPTRSPNPSTNFKSDTPNDSLASDHSQRVAYADNTNTEPAGLSAYDHNKDPSSTPSSSRSRSRSRGAYDTHRSSQSGGSVWTNDTEGKHKKILKKVFDHKLAPDFLE